MAEAPTTPDAAEARPGTVELALLTFLCMLPVTLVVPVLKGLVRDNFETGDFGVSLFMSINMIAAVIFGPFSGVISKRISPRISIPLMLAADAVLFAGLSVTSTWNTFVVLRFLEGAAHIGALSILLGLCAEISRRQVGRDGRLMGIVGAALTLGVAAGPPLGGKIGAEDPIAVFRFGAGLAAVAAVFGFLILRKLPTLETAPSQDKPAVFQLARERKRLLLPFLFAFCDRFTVGFFVTSFPLYLATCHEVPSARIGLLLALFLLPFALLCYPAGRLIDRLDARLPFLLFGSILYGVATTQVGRVDLQTLPYLMVLLGVLSSFMFVPSLMLTARYAGEGKKAGAMGGFNAAGSLGFLVGPLVAGWVSTRTEARTGLATEGYAVAFEVAGVAEIVCALAALVYLALRQRTSPVPEIRGQE